MSFTFHRIAVGICNCFLLRGDRTILGPLTFAIRPGERWVVLGPNGAGKSTLFNALTNAQIQAENYPFCTIEPNVGVVPVPDSRLAVLAEVVHTEKLVPATVTFTDIAGIVKGASQGEGLGNKFLSETKAFSIG